MGGPGTHLRRRRLHTWGGALIICAGTVMLFAGVGGVLPAAAQMLTFPPRPKPPVRPERSQEQMLVRAEEIRYDYTNERVSAVGNVQLYFGSSTLEADRVIYDQKTKRLHAEGNVQLTEGDGTVTRGEIMDLSDDYRDGFVDSLRLDAPEQTRFAAPRAERSGNFTVFHNGVYTACEPCVEDPTRPPKWQVKAARIIHDQSEKMLYFEDARLEFAGVPMAYLPYMSAPDPTVKRKTGVLTPNVSTSSVYGAAVTVPYYWALAPDYDFTFTPMITSKQGPLLQGEWRQRLIEGAYSIRASGLFQLDKNALVNTPGFLDWRGSIDTSGQFNLSDKWVWGWSGTVLSDRNYLYDYGLARNLQTTGLITNFSPDYALSQVYLAGRGDRSYFDMRALYFYGLSPLDVQSQLPVVHPVIDHDYVFNSPIFGGELSFHNNLISLSREAANFDAISQAALTGGLCAQTADPAVINRNNCVLRGVPDTYTRASTEWNWKATVIDSFGQMFTPFVSVRADFADMNVANQPGVANFINVGQSDVGRVMPVAGLEYRYPLINVQSWGTQTIEPIAQLIFRPNETFVGSFPNEDAQSLIFDDSNLFKINKFSGWDRVEGGGRANAGIQYTAQFNRGGNVNFLFGQSYQLYGLNSFALPSTTNTGINSGLDTANSDYVARASYQPNSLLRFTSRFRFAESDFTLQRTELETSANFGRWTTTVMYGNYAPQPLIGFLDRREGILGSARFKLNPNWVLLGSAGYDIHHNSLTQTQIGAGYIDDCLILALSYITSYAYSGSVSVNHSYMMQLTLRTLGGTSSTSAPEGPAITPGVFGSTH
jgi:LPS-assembly protein